MTPGYAFAFSRHDVSEFSILFRPLSIARAQGRPGARRTRGLMRHVHKRKCAHEHTGLAETSRPSLRDGLTTYTCSLRRDHAGLSPSSAKAFALTKSPP